MKRALKLLTVLDIVFLLLLSLSGSIAGIGGDVVYLLAFAIPLLVGAYLSRGFKREREEERGLAEAELVRFGISADGLCKTLPLVIPTVAVVFGVAWLTSLLLGAFGFSGSAVVDAPLWQMLLVHAVAPAILEELLFRYLPIKLLYPYSPRGCVLISSLYFALIHLDIFKLPYAFIAGVLLVTVDLISGSILPSLIIHFINNLTSVLLMKYGESPTFTTVYYSVLGGLCAVSLLFVFLRLKKYRAELSHVFERGRLEYDYSPFMLSLMCVGIAIFNLLGGVR